MKYTQKAFTLIELLVVVLIIAILVAVALPQYQLSVAKARYATIKALARSLERAQEVYFMSHGHYADTIAELDVTMPGNYNPKTSTPKQYRYDWGTCEMAQTIALCRYSKGTFNLQYQIRLKYAKIQWAGTTACIAEYIGMRTNRNSLQDKVCKSETKKTKPDKETVGWSHYLY